MMRAHDVEDIYGLTPMQAGMLYHTVAATTPDMYAQQGSCALDGPLDARRLAGSWREAVAAHHVLRTCFRWIDLTHPVQIVRRSATLPVHIVENPALGDDTDESERQWTRLLEDDLSAGFDLREAPLLRVRLVRASATSHRLIWTYHHIVLDAWSEAHVLRDVMAVYQGAARAAPRPFHDYVKWLAHRQQLAQPDFWINYLAGYRHRPLPSCAHDGTPNVDAPEVDAQDGDAQGGDAAESAERTYTATRTVSAGAKRELEARAAAAHVTPHAVMLAIFAEWLCGRTGADEVVIGITVSGRDDVLPDAEHHVGVLFQTLPLRVRRHPHQSMTQHAAAIQRDLVAIQQQPAATQAQLRACVAPESPAVFDSVMVFLNAGLQVHGRELGAARIRDVRYRSRSNYPLTFRVIDDDPLLFEVVAQPRHLPRQAADALLTSCEHALIDEEAHVHSL